MSMFEFMRQSFFTLVSVVLVLVTALILYGAGKVIVNGCRKTKSK